MVNPIVKDRLQRLNPGKDEKELVRSFYQKKFKIAGLAIGVGTLLGVFLFISDHVNKKISPEGEILRESYEGSAIEIPATVHSSRYGEVDVDIVVDRQTYTGEELEEIFDQAEIWLDRVILGDNEDLGSVRKDLVFPAFYEDTEIAIQYTSSNYGLVNGSGEVKNEELEKEEQLVIKAEFSYGDAIREREYAITVYPPFLTQEEIFKKTLADTISDENIRQKEKEVFLLPDQIGEEQVVFQEKGNKRFLYVICLGILCAAFLYKGMDRDLDKLYERRKQQLIFCYPEFVSKLALLTGAGMSVTGAVRRIYADREDQKEEPLYEELGIFIRELDNGILEERALENLGKRSGLIQYRKFCSLLCANMKKGSVNLKNLLEKEAEEAFTDHQIQIKKLGEEAGTKLLLPMIMMLAVVMIIIMVPAFMSYQIS